MLQERYQEQLKNVIIKLGAIRYVRINQNDGFFLIKEPGRNLRPKKIVLPGLKAFDAMSNCVIFHKNKFIKRYWLDEEFEAILEKPKKRIGYRSSMENLFSALKFSESNKTTIRKDLNKVEAYLEKYAKQIKDSPEFVIANLFLINKDGIIPKQNLKIYFPLHSKYINDFLRAVGLLKEKRGKLKPTDKIAEKLKETLKSEFKSISEKKPLPIQKLQKRLTEEVNKLFPNDPKGADKYYWSDSTIRRIVNNSSKK